MIRFLSSLKDNGIRGLRHNANGFLNSHKAAQKLTQLKFFTGAAFKTLNVNGGLQSPKDTQDFVPHTNQDVTDTNEANCIPKAIRNFVTFINQAICNPDDGVPLILDLFAKDSCVFATFTPVLSNSDERKTYFSDLIQKLESCTLYSNDFFGGDTFCQCRLTFNLKSGESVTADMLFVIDSDLNIVHLHSTSTSFQSEHDHSRCEEIWSNGIVECLVHKETRQRVTRRIATGESWVSIVNQ